MEPSDRSHIRNSNFAEWRWVPGIEKSFWLEKKNVLGEWSPDSRPGPETLYGVLIVGPVTLVYLY
jgi:hypothetical protein